MHVRLHELLNKINFLELAKRQWLEDVKDCNDVLMMEMPEKFDLP
jgi:hypothetical protein